MLKTNLFSSNSAELSGFLPEGHSYGFNGKELDSEGMGGGLSTYDYGFRIYNPALAKFLSVDPLNKSYPFYSPYQYAGNKPIACIDLDGLEEVVYTKDFLTLHCTALSILNSSEHCENVLMELSDPNLASKHKIYITGHSRSVAQGLTWANPGESAQKLQDLEMKYAGDISNLTKEEAREREGLLSHFDDLQISYKDVLNDMAEGKQVTIVSIDIDVSLGTDGYSGKADPVFAAFAVMHELNAHLRQILAGDKPSNEIDHKKYYGITSEEMGTDLKGDGQAVVTGYSLPITHKWIDEYSQAVKDYNGVMEGAKKLGIGPSDRLGNREKKK